MKLNAVLQPNTLPRQLLAVSMAAALSLAAVASARAATPEPVKAAAGTASATAVAPADQCLKDLSAFQVQMQKDGYWRGYTGYGYGYPMVGYGYDGGMLTPDMAGGNKPVPATFWNARPGFEVRTLIAATQIMAQRGQQVTCEALLAETRAVYDHYASEMRSGDVPRYDVKSYRQAQLASAQPVVGQNISYRSDQLIGTEVLNPKGEELGSVDDLVLSPKTGQIAYLVIARGGLFGINEKHVPVPWAIFKATTGAKMLMLDTTKAAMLTAPQVKENRFTVMGGDFDKLSQEVDSYWSAHVKK